MNKRKIMLGIGALMLAAVGAFAAAKTAVVGAYYISTGGTCLFSPTVSHPCENINGTCIVAVPEDANQLRQLYQSIDEFDTCQKPLRP